MTSSPSVAGDTIRLKMVLAMFMGGSERGIERVRRARVVAAEYPTGPREVLKRI
jgi:hypothetical protein